MFKPLVAIVGMLISITTHATLIDNNDFTTDTIAQRDWLDLTFTDNMSYEQVLAETTSGGLFEGWTIATHTDVYDFFNNAGGDGDYTDTNNTIFNDLYTLWGQMPYFNDTSWFFVEDQTINQSTSGMIIWQDTSVTYSQAFTDFNESNKNIGAALFRSTAIPEPRMTVLFILSLICMVALCSNRRQSKGFSVVH